MSFWLEDDDALVNNQQNNNSGENTDSGFLCSRCGSTTSYYDDASGKQACTQCFALSQVSKTVDDVDDDIEDVVALANRGNHGRLSFGVHGHHANNKRYNFNRRLAQIHKKAPEDLNRATRLPNAQECTRVYQRILKSAAQAMFRLLKFNENDADLGMRILQTLWQTYVQNWSDGAEYYGRLYPSMRFSFRDAFIQEYRIRNNLYKQLSYNVAQKISNNNNKNADEAVDGEYQDNNQNNEEEDDFDDDGNDNKRYEFDSLYENHDIRPDLAVSNKKRERDDFEDDDDSYEHINTKKRKLDPNDSARKKNKSDTDDIELDEIEHSKSQNDKNNNSKDHDKNKLKRLSHYPHFLFGDFFRQEIFNGAGRMETALFLRPNMTLAAAFLYLTVARRGVSLSQILAWIKSNEIPLINAYELLSPRWQKRIVHIKSTLTLWVPPTLQYLQSTAQFLAVACSVKDATSYASYWSKLSNDEIISHHGLSTINAQSLPLLLAQLCADIHLPTSVLKIALVLLGIKKPPFKAIYGRLLYLPRQPNFEAITTMYHVVALIFCACMVHPEWRNWQIVSTPSSSLSLLSSTFDSLYHHNNKVTNENDKDVNDDRHKDIESMNDSDQKEDESINDDDDSDSEKSSVGYNDNYLNNLYGIKRERDDDSHSSYNNNNDREDNQPVSAFGTAAFNSDTRAAVSSANKRRWIPWNAQNHRLVCNGEQLADLVDFWDELFDHDFDSNNGSVDKTVTSTTPVIAPAFVKKIRKAPVVPRVAQELDDQEIQFQQYQKTRQSGLRPATVLATLGWPGSAKNYAYEDLGFTKRLFDNFVPGMSVNSRLVRQRLLSLRLDCAQQLLLEYLAAVHQLSVHDVYKVLSEMLN